MKIILSLFSLLLSSSVWAAGHAYKVSYGIGAVADNMLVPVTIVAGFVSAACLVIGFSCEVAALIRYFEYRKNPLYVPISKVLWLIFLGAILLLLPFAYLITDNGLPFTLIHW